jgi:hypothetical protein
MDIFTTLRLTHLTLERCNVDDTTCTRWNFIGSTGAIPNAISCKRRRIWSCGIQRLGGFLPYGGLLHCKNVSQFLRLTPSALKKISCSSYQADEVKMKITALKCGKRPRLRLASCIVSLFLQGITTDWRFENRN